MPLPPLDEQQRIAAILDKADALRRKRKRALEMLDGLTQSIFLETTAFDETRVLRLGDFATVRGGKRLPKGHDYTEEKSCFRYLRVKDIRTGNINRDHLKRLAEETQKLIAQYVVDDGDIVISIAGTIGATLYINPGLAGVNLTENAARITVSDQNTIDPFYLTHALRSPSVQSQIKASTGQVTIGKLALFRIEELAIPVPFLDRQIQFRDAVSRVQVEFERAQSGEMKCNLLFASLQSRAFCGAI